MAQDDGKSNLRRQIDENLRRAYDETVSEPVPDRFEVLLAQLKSQQERRDDGNG